MLESRLIRVLQVRFLNDEMIEQIASGAYPEIISWAGLKGDEEFVPLRGTFAKDMSSDPIRAAIADNRRV